MSALLYRGSRMRRVLVVVVFLAVLSCPAQEAQAGPFLLRSQEPCPSPLPGGALVKIAEVDAKSGQETVAVTVSFVSSGAHIAGIQNDIVFDPALVDLASKFSCAINPAIGLATCAGPDDPCKILTGGLGDCPGPIGCAEGMRYFHGIVVALDNINVIPDGVLYTCTFSIVGEPAFAAILENENTVASDPAGERVAAEGCDGTIIVAATETPTRAPTPTRTNTATQTHTSTPTATYTSTRTYTATHTVTATPTHTPTHTYTATQLPSSTPLPCAGDCDGGKTVTVDELITGVAIALGETTADTCAAMDTNEDQMVSIDELVTAVEQALAGCAP